MKSVLPVFTVVAAIFVVWYASAVALNAPWTHDQAERAGVVLTFSELVSDTWSQKKPKLPAPHQVAQEIWKTTGEMVAKGRGFSKRSLISHSWVTLSATLLGFALGVGLGVLLAVGIVYSRVMDMSVMPWVIASQTIPILAIAPMIIVVLNAVGISGLLPKAIISMYLSFFPVVVDMVKGLRSPDGMQLDQMRTWSANKSQEFWYLRMPSSMPYLFASLKVAMAASLVGGGADVVLDWMPSVLASREKGLPIVNIAQPFKSSGMMLTCRKDAGVETPEDFAGKTLGVWFFGNEYPFLSWMSKLGYSTEGGDEGVTVLKQGFNVDPILQGQAACVSTMTYNEYWQIIDAGLTPEDLVVFKYEDQGVATLEDGMYVLEENLSDPAFVDKMVRFVRASMKGWKWAEENPVEAALIVLDNDATGAQTEDHQIRMMGEVAKLTEGSDGTLDPADYERTVDSLMSGGSDPVITKAPEGAWTHAITDLALN